MRARLNAGRARIIVICACRRGSVMGNLAFVAQPQQWASRISAMVIVSPIRKGPFASMRLTIWLWLRVNSHCKLSLIVGRRCSSGKTKLWRAAVHRSASNSSRIRCVRLS